MKTRFGKIKFGNCDNVQIQFSISHISGVEMDCLDINICSGDNQDFYCKTTMHVITAEVIDELCDQLNSLKGKLKYDLAAGESDWKKEYRKLRNTLNNLYLLVKHETNLPESAANGVESQGLDEGIVRASDIIERARLAG